MKIVNKGRGVHDRELSGIEELKAQLPDAWRGFTNLELALPGGGREIDLIMVIEDRILAVDLKDWRGPIRSEEGYWKQGNVAERSPAEKILGNKRELFIKLKLFLEAEAKRKGKNPKSADIPKVQGFVVLTACKDRSGIAPTEQDCVYSIEPFIKMLRNTKSRIEEIGGVAPAFHSPGLTTPDWMATLSTFFNVRNGAFRASARQYGSYRALTDQHCYQHPSQVFTEYDVEDAGAGRASGLLRRWDFTKAEVRFQSEAGRREIGGRERAVIAWLNDRNDASESAILQPRAEDTEVGVGYWEVFDRRRKLRRISDHAAAGFNQFTSDARKEISRQILARVKMLHDLGAAHLDIGPHSVWIELPSTVRLSHLMAASFPEIQTLGDRRYQFLSIARLPEEMMSAHSPASKRDVYLLGTLIHSVIFGVAPKLAEGSDLGEWSESIDPTAAYAELYGWFARALDWEPSNRFESASEMLLAFNQACSTDRSQAAVITGLERFRKVSSQRHLLRDYPEVQLLHESDRVEAWESSKDGCRVVVKLWKREGWGDQAREAPRILDFLEKAQEIVEQPLPGFAKLRDVVWLGDAIALVQDFVEGVTLDEMLREPFDRFRSVDERLLILRRLIALVGSAHERQFAHGDLKPANIVISDADGPSPILIDYLDFSPESDGERISSAYAPSDGGRLERDRFALCKIIEESLAGIEIPESRLHRLTDAISKVRVGPPPNATLLPLADALAPVEASSQGPVRRVLVGLSDAKAGPLLADEGAITLRLAKGHGRQLYIRGACEQLLVHLDESRAPINARRMPIDQKRIGAAAMFEVAIRPCEFEIVAGPINDFAALAELLRDPDVASQLWKEQSASVLKEVEPTAHPDDESLIDDEDDDDDEELVAGEATKATRQDSILVDVPLLWRQSIDVETELKIEGVATGDSAFRPSIMRHVAPFQMEAGDFEFDKDDTVTVSRWEGGQRWTKLGVVDVSGTRGDYIQINTSRTAFRSSDTIVHEGNRLRFASHFEETSRSRRRSAVERILEGQARIPDLVKFFSNSAEPTSQDMEHDVDPQLLRETYKFNDGQVDAFCALLRRRPLSLLQGPPGTGKTRFIGALIHYAIGHGLARNVLVASQSHEAVNGAAESILGWFGGRNSPSILRVGHEGNVSELLMPFHVARVETLLKDRFRAESKERLQQVGVGLGIPSELCLKLIHIETVAAPIARRLLELKSRTGADSARIEGLAETLRNVTAAFESSLDLAEETFIESLCFEIAARSGFGNASIIERFREVMRVSEDFVTSVSTRTRNFESFLAGTRQVVAGTCVGLGRSSLGLVSTSFDLVIVDEAARCTSGELAVPMQAGRWVVLVGDQNQLEPMIKKRVLNALVSRSGLPKDELLRSDFERVFENSASPTMRKTLTTQYRMLEPIGSLVSDSFYKVPLLHGRTEPVVPRHVLPEFLSRPLIWLSTDGFGADAHQSPPRDRTKSLENVREADLIIDAIRLWDGHEPFRDWLESQKQFVHVIGIICTYAAQSDLIRKRLRTSYISDAMRQTIKIDTVDSYQGKENPIVLLSLVRHNDDGHMEDGKKTIEPGFMYRANRINVAMSRAMDRLVIVGASTRWRVRDPMGRVVNAFGRQCSLDQAHYVDAVQFRGLMGIAQAEKRTKKATEKGGRR